MRVSIASALILVIGTVSPAISPAQAQSVSVTAVAQTLCGDGLVQVGEECDSGNLNNASCAGLGHMGGILSCSSRCTLVADQCTDVNGGGGNGVGEGIAGAPFSIPQLQTSVIISGKADPNGTVVITEGGVIRVTVAVGPTGDFRASFNTLGGLHFLAAYTVDQHGRRSPQYPLRVTANQNIVTSVSGIVLPPVIKIVDENQPRRLNGDLENDGRINIVDLSILLYWWRTSLPQGLVVADINHDGKVNLVDLSILLFNWTR